MQNNDVNIAVIGASGSLGGEFVKQLASQDSVRSVFAFSRSKTDFKNDKITSHFLDIEDETSIQHAATVISKEVKFDMVIVATGMLHDQDIQPEKSIRDLSKHKFQQIFNINTIAPAMLIKHFMPKLKKDTQSVFAVISARVSSISDNYLGGWYAYRASKTALNMIVKNTAIEVKRSNKNAIIIGLHPGTVDSNLSKPFQSAISSDKLFTPEYSVQQMLNVVANLTPTNSGNLLDFKGITIDF